MTEREVASWREPAKERNCKSLFPDARQFQRQQPQHGAHKSLHHVGLREHTGLNKDLRRDSEADGGEQQAGAADDDRQIAYRGCDWPCG
ncbi:bsr4099 [Bradyrhizobium diazoefficiens USDA 110]|uniref:Bsr4099 protein n=1 Tax=Bradyrhizobium diazoefficiens (strain JCM 10833 / BCRC 13528 / IAM 13628 / NBRC 14792 / USDA 110) TaxID=224911 RepID=Q89MU3_BRADU|nr:hypothetical protein CO678_14310 [Bradyrhizobium diazoefficiens]QBP22866.1 hypothetical protein Bdiaspc4_21215 [Bradyrhizobium diazoefficiens]BAC49364.1 bsr4099 [Bradyrhizobium diazoefficiens USDA 110]